MIRPTRHDILMGVANLYAQRSTCDRLHVGAVISMYGRPITGGYNGTAAGLDHCVHIEGSTEPCLMAVHAEANAIAFAARHGLATENAEITVTHMPCLACAKLIINAGIRCVVWGIPFRDEFGIELLKQAGVQVHKYLGVQPR